EYKYDGRKGLQAYRPFTLLSFAVEKDLFGNKPAAAHFINVLIYALLLLVVYKLLTKLFPETSYQLLIMIALLYLVHPVHSEVVASVKSRDELLAGLFGFLALAAFLDPPGKTRPAYFKLIPALLFLAAMF